MQPGTVLMLSAAALAGCVGDGAAVESSATHVEALRPNTPDGGEPPPRFDPDDRVEHWPSPGGGVLVHFTRAGRNAVPAADVDADGTPDYVALVGRTYDAVVAHHRDVLGFRPPPDDRAVPVDNGGDARFDVYLVDFAGRADGAYRRERCEPDLGGGAAGCAGYMLQENDFAGYRYASLEVAVRTVASHEFFHAVQAGYGADRGVVLSEATAVWATERFDPALDDLERLAAGYLAASDRPLDEEPAGPPDNFSYGVGLFFEHQTARHGGALVRELWEAQRPTGATAPAPWLAALDALLRDRYASTFAAEFEHFAGWSLFTAARTDPRFGPAQGAMLASLQVTRGTLPFQTDHVRLLRASLRAYSFAPRGRAEVRLAVRLVAGVDPAALDGVVLLTAARRSGTVAGPVRAQAVTAAAPLDLDVRDADEVLALLVNTRARGASAQVAFCAGDAAELAACTSAGDSDAGVALGDASDAGTDAPAPADAASAPTAPGCTCHTARGASHSSAFGLIFAALVAVTRRRRR